MKNNVSSGGSDVFYWFFLTVIMIAGVLATELPGEDITELLAMTYSQV